MYALDLDSVDQIRESDFDAIPPAGEWARHSRRCAMRLRGIPAVAPTWYLTANYAATQNNWRASGRAGVPGSFQDVTALYMTEYERRVSTVYVTIRNKIRSLARFWEIPHRQLPRLRVGRCRRRADLALSGAGGRAIIRRGYV